MSNIYLALLPVTYFITELPILVSLIIILGINFLSLDKFHYTFMTSVVGYSYYSSDLNANEYLGFLLVYLSNGNIVLITIPSI